MPYTPIAPNLVEAIVGHIRYHQKNLGARYHSEDYTEHETAGEMTTVGGATVEVMALVKFDKKYSYGQDAERSVQVGATAKCHGWGCADPRSEESFGEAAPLDANGYDIAATAEPLVQAAREWAQAHAEKCRAQPYTGR
ncbi:hypothetical protein [Streptomyces sp. BA2]|uniref:hypothetical protein n=1 Tax=Streptomyces sp. BA2 TaxID=436595 RepID=UPI001322C8A9|nr:hypothetical protein [Streptomyces sp. BA2]MWA08789.1 hypothetical protein [Streptomyces sp. BA2]